MKSFALSLLLLIPVASLPGHASEETAFMLDFLAGDYVVIGKAANTGEAYTGKLILRRQHDYLFATRIIEGSTITGKAQIETALGQDKAKVLRLRFEQGGIAYEATYSWHSDLDNYARLAGYVYRQGKKTAKPGMEALFYDHAARQTDQ